jgi:putative flippase GtrA
MATSVNTSSSTRWNTPAGFLRFTVVGALCFGSSILLVWTLTDIVGLHYLVSTAIATMVGNVFGWLLNRSWTYSARRPRSAGEFVRYAAINLAGMAMSLSGVALLVNWASIHYVTACAVVAIAMTIVNFQLHGRVSLRMSRDDA